MLTTIDAVRAAALENATGFIGNAALAAMNPLLVNWTGAARTGMPEFTHASMAEDLGELIDALRAFKLGLATDTDAVARMRQRLDLAPRSSL